MIAAPDGGRIDYVPRARRETRRLLTEQLAPRAERGAVAQVYTARQGWVLNAVGRYRFFARLAMDDGSTIEAPSVEIDVQPPPSNLSLIRFAPFWDALSAALYEGRVDAASAATRMTEERGSPFGYLRPFVDVAQVIAESQQQYSRGTQQFERPHCGKSAANPREVIRRMPDPYFSAVAAVRLQRCMAGGPDASTGAELVGEVRAAHRRMAAHPVIDVLLREISKKD